MDNIKKDVVVRLEISVDDEVYSKKLGQFIENELKGVVSASGCGTSEFSVEVRIEDAKRKIKAIKKAIKDNFGRRTAFGVAVYSIGEFSENQINSACGDENGL